MEDQDELIKRKSHSEDVALEANNKAMLEDVGCNAELYIVTFYDTFRPAIQKKLYVSALINSKKIKFDTIVEKSDIQHATNHAWVDHMKIAILQENKFQKQTHAA